MWGRRQLAKQLRWRWRDDPVRQAWCSEGRVRCVLARHPELHPPPSVSPTRMPRHIDYLTCNLIWAVDIQDTRLADGSRWQTLHWIDLHSRYVLGQLSVPSLTEALVVTNFLAVARQYGLPRIIKADHDKLWFDAISGLPSLLTRVLSALGIYHLLVGPKQPWWNGVVERYVRTCREETPLPEDAADLPQVMADGRDFYNQERCHSRCQDRPPVTAYQPSTRRLPADFDLAQVPLTLVPTVVTRQVQADGRISLAGRTLRFQRCYAGQSIAVTVSGWAAVAQAADGWQRTYDLQPAAEQPPTAPPPAMPPQPLTRIVNRRGNITINSYLYYVGIA
jgi:transposase InsO family protein